MILLINEAKKLNNELIEKSAELTSKTDKLIKDINEGMLGPKGSQMRQEALREEKAKK